MVTKTTEWNINVGYQLSRTVTNSYQIYQYDPVRLFFMTLDGELKILFDRITFEYGTKYLIFE